MGEQKRGEDARPRRGRLQAWSPATSRDEARAYLQERMALFSRLMFWIFWVLVVFVIALYQVYPEARPDKVDIVHDFAIGALVVGGIIWYFALHRGQPSIEVLYRIDLLFIMIIGVAFGISTYYSCDQRANVYSGFIWHTFAVFTRVVILPSSGRRTTAVTAASFVPLMVSAVAQSIYYPEQLELAPAAFIVGSGLFAVVATLLARTGSQVIYGLRRQINAAMQLGQYTLEDKIGEGGMGAVYRARHAMLRRPTAVKLLPIDRYGAEGIERFEREVQHMSRLTHPNTVAVFDYGRTPDGVFYYAMEYLDGVDLETLVRREGPLPPARVIHILRQICGALDEAHSMGLIHRDIKPANVLLCQRGRKPDVAKVVDFGLVKEMTHKSSDSAPVTITGTPAYLAPEAVTQPSKIGPQSDLYSLGALAYYLLTGALVYEAKTSVLMCLQHVTAEPVPPSQRAGIELPADLEALIMQCLAKDPARRPDSALALRTSLTRLPAYRDWDETAALEWWREFTLGRAAGKAKGRSRTGLSTITVDVQGRTEELVELLAEDPEELPGAAVSAETSRDHRQQVELN